MGAAAPHDASPRRGLGWKPRCPRPDCRRDTSSVSRAAERRSSAITRDQPDAPVVLLLHGWTASADLQWCTIYPELCARYSVIAIDHRGHGRGIRSEEEFTLEDCADDAAAAVRLLDPGPAGDRDGLLDGWADHAAALSTAPGPRRRHRLRGHRARDGTTAFEDRFRWRFLVFLERMLKSRRMHNWIARYLREEVHTNPELEAHVPWMLAEMRRTDTRAVVEAGPRSS